MCLVHSKGWAFGEYALIKASIAFLTSLDTVTVLSVEIEKIRETLR